MTFHLDHVSDHRETFLADREPALIAQEQLAADPLLEAVDPPHQGGAGDAEQVGGVAETFVPCAGEERSQLVPGCIKEVVSLVLRDRSTLVQ